MGFTEAKLGFVLAAAFAALGVATLQELPAEEESNSRYEDALKQRDSMSVAIASLRDSIALARAAARDSTRVKLSTKTPGCWEKGEPRAPLADIRVLGLDRYALRGDTVNFNGVQSRLARHIARADSLKCRYGLRVFATRGVDAADHSAAVLRLRLRFDVDERAR
jgi:hypothetical protein